MLRAICSAQRLAFNATESKRYSCRRQRTVATQVCPFKSILSSTSLNGLPFKGLPPGRPYKLLLGLRQPEDPWLDLEEDDELLLYQLQQRAKHINERRGAVIQVTDEPLAREASRELLEQLLVELSERHPNRFRATGSTITNLLTGESFDTTDPEVDPLEVAGRITQEDYCLLAPGDGAYRLIGGVVCFPAHWSVLEKLGLGLPDIHDPVPRWRSDAAHPVHNFMSRLSPAKPFIRWNWTLSTTDELHLSKWVCRRFYHPPPSPRAAPPDDVAGIDFLQLRLERQHFHRLPRTGCVVFTIRTYMQPLAEAIRGRPRVAEALAGALRDLPYEYLQYKSNLQLRLPALLELLDSVAAGTTAAAETVVSGAAAGTTAAAATARTEVSGATGAGGRAEETAMA